MDHTTTFAHAGWQTLAVTGSERLPWLSGVLTCDTRNLTSREAVWGLALDRKGKIQSEIWVLETGQRALCAVSEGRGQALLTHLDSMLIMEDAELSWADEFDWFESFGPDAAKSAALFEAAGGQTAKLARGSVSSWLSCLPKGTRVPLTPLGAEHWARFRIDHGLPEFGIDFDSGERPHEAGLDRLAVSWSKGCYLGQEVVCMQDMRGKVSRRLRMGTCEPGVAQVGDVVRGAGRDCGVVRTAVAGAEGDSDRLVVMLKTDAVRPLELASGETLRLFDEPES